MKKKFIIIATLFLGGAARAQDYSQPAEVDEVVVERPLDLTKNYRDRRSRFGLLAAVNYERFSPDNYVSINLNKSFKEFSGESSVPLVSGDLGLKINFEVGSLSLLAGYASGQFENDSANVYSITTNMLRLSANLALDTLMEEPWVVPYGQVGVHQLNWTEKSYDNANNIINQSVTAPWTLNYKVGALIQLNWVEDSIDPQTHINGLQSSGLENTYLDIFYQHYGTTDVTSENEIGTVSTDFESSNFGVGLKLEF